VYRVLEATLPSLRHVNQYVLLLLLLLLLKGKILKQSHDNNHALLWVICHPVARINIAYSCTRFNDFSFSRSSDKRIVDFLLVTIELASSHGRGTIKRYLSKSAFSDGGGLL